MGDFRPRLTLFAHSPPQEGGRRLSRSEGGGSDSSKDGSIQSDTSLDSEDSCVSVIFVPHPEDKPALACQHSTSNSSESSESPTGWGSPEGAKTTSPNKIHAKKVEIEVEVEINQEDYPESEALPVAVEAAEPKSPSLAPTRPPLPEHKSFEAEDLPNQSPINCHRRALAERVECDAPPLSPQPHKPSSKYDYPIVRHHPLFAKNQRCRSGTISSLLVGENIEFFRKPGANRTGVQSTRQSKPKLLTFEIYNPETDDLDSDSSLSSSPDSGESVVSVISDVKSFESKKQNEEVISGPDLEKTSPEDDIIFKFDFPENPEVAESPVTSPPDTDTAEFRISDIALPPDVPLVRDASEDIMDAEEIDKKFEKRKQDLIHLLDENKSVLAEITKNATVEEVSWKTASQLQSMEELRLPSFERSHSSSSSPERRDCHSEGEQRLHNLGEVEERTGSLEGLDSLPEKTSEEKKQEDNPTTRRRRISAQKLLQINQRVEEEVGEEDGGLVAPVAICVTEVEVTEQMEVVKEEQQEEDVPAVSPEVPGKRKESAAKVLMHSESKEEEKVTPPSRRPGKRQRDDSLESNSASIKSSVQLSDTGSLLSHRFSTISISSNVSSDVSLGNTSAVSGSSCYLASMSSADFDDRPALASSFSLSEAEEEKEKEGTGSDTKEPSSPPKKDQLSPPRPGGSSKSGLPAGRGDRPKLKTLFKRSSDGRSKSHSSSEGRSREGEGDCLAVKGARSRIGTLTSMTPETSLEQNTCVERGSSSFEEELLRNKGHGTETGDDNAFSASDSDDSAEAGGNLTHHR